MAKAAPECAKCPRTAMQNSRSRCSRGTETYSVLKCPARRRTRMIPSLRGSYAHAEMPEPEMSRAVAMRNLFNRLREGEEPSNQHAGTASRRPSSASPPAACPRRPPVVRVATKREHGDGSHAGSNRLA